MKYRVSHTSAYSYRRPVDLASHMLHLSPRPLAHQRVISATLESVPACARSNEGVDHFGNGVHWLFLERPHDSFEVTASAVVDVAFPPPPPDADTAPWEEVAAAAAAGGRDAWQAAEFVFDSPMARIDAQVAAYAAVSFPPGRAVLSALRDFNARIRQDFAFRAGVTTIATPVGKVLAQRAGVCQDFTHLMISGLRAHGLPARYVSGYIRTRPPPGAAPRRGADQSHAWVGAWLGARHGWIDLDPTNNLVVQDEHVVLAWGRDYGDVSPVRGVILGGGKHTLTVSVDLQPA